MQDIPPIAKATVQAALISASSNVLAQGITSYRDQVPPLSPVKNLEYLGCR